MNRPTSYYIAGEHPYPENELARLNTQVAVSWDKELRIMRTFGLRPDSDVLEVGSGPGFVTRLLLDAVPEGTVTCLELEQELLGHAREYLGDFVGDQVTLLNGSVLDYPLPEASADIAFARLVLQHVPQPVTALENIHKALRPGGRVVITDIDDGVWGMIDPDPGLAALDEVLRLRIELQKSRGGNRLIGRELPRMLRAAGFTDIKVEALAVSTDEYGMPALAPQLNFRSRTAAMVAANPAAAQACEELADAVDEWMQSPLSSMIMLMFMFSGVKE